MENVIYLGIPTYPGGMVHYGTVHGVMDAMASERVILQFIAGSYTTHNFNTLWSEALNLRERGVTHFCMLHVDIDPETGWLGKMLRIMNEHKADILSAVIPVKSGAGYTSTAFESGENEVRRYTMKEVIGSPEKTFTRPGILLNNGLMLVDLTKPWVEKVSFSHNNGIVMRDGKRQAIGFPEDWHFSRQARELGASLYATAEVKVEHIGEYRYRNDVAWGAVAHDGGCPAMLKP